MAGTPDMMSCAPPTELQTLLLSSPFYALRYHFGMLLGVDDFQTEQAYYRGKMRLHNAWLHRDGVVWGLGVSINKQKELQVDPGLALDAAGHELHLDGPACLNLGAWYEAHQADDDLTVTKSAGGARAQFDAHVIIRFKACLSRQVPALASPCEGANTDTAYSRTFETVEILLVPGKGPVLARPYHRLRLLFGLEPPLTDEQHNTIKDDQDVLNQRAAILALGADDQAKAYLDAFRKLAVLDELDLKPPKEPDGAPTPLFPATDDTSVVLAQITVKVAKLADGWTSQTTDEDINESVRPVHVATSTIQELLCGPRFDANGGSAADAGGPRVDPATVKATGITVTMDTDKPLASGTVSPSAFSVASRPSDDTAKPWSEHQVIDAKFAVGASANTITLELDPNLPLEDLVRVVVRGTGPTPILGAAPLVPLAGEVGGPRGTASDGHDFAVMLKRS